MNHRPSARSALLAGALAVAVGVAGWLLASGHPAHTAAHPAAHVAGRTAARPYGTTPAPAPAGSRTLPKLPKRPAARVGSMPRITSSPVRRIPGVHLPKHPTAPQHRAAAPKTSPPALVQLPGIKLGGHCAAPNFPARTSDGTAVVCLHGTWQRR